MDALTFYKLAVICLWVVCGGGMIICSLMYLIRMLQTKKVSLKIVFRDFKQKIWMTAGLGLLFSMLYVLIVLLSSYFSDSAIRLKWFFAAYANPQHFIYFGLLIFVFVSISILCVRTIIKHLYHINKR